MESAMAPAALRRLAGVCAALVFAVTSLSAFVRFGRLGGAASAHAIEVARGTHRACASLALLLAIVLLVRCFMRTPPLPRAGRLAGAVVGVGIALALLGASTGESVWPPVVLANLLGGYAMLVLAAAVALSVGTVRVAWPGRVRQAVVAAAVLFVATQVALALGAVAAPLPAALALNMAAALLAALAVAPPLAG